MLICSGTFVRLPGKARGIPAGNTSLAHSMRLRAGDRCFNGRWGTTLGRLDLAHFVNVPGTVWKHLPNGNPNDELSLVGGAFSQIVGDCPLTLRRF